MTAASLPDLPTPRPDFDNLLMVLNRRVPARPTLAELFHNDRLYRRVIGPEEVRRLEESPIDTRSLLRLHGYHRLGYDYASVQASDFAFEKGGHGKKETRSLNEGGLVTDRASFEAYKWPEPSDFPDDRLESLREELPEGMKLVVLGPSGVLENTIQLVGYDALCLMLYDDADLAGEIFAGVGSRILAYYQSALEHDTVGAIWANDDWGFKTQTMLPPEAMRRFVIPWHKKIAAAAHAAGKPCLLHCCGEIHAVLDDIIDEIGHDARHSYEDAIQPVEDAYEEYGDRIAILGGMDVDFLVREAPERILRRARAMLERTATRGGYALGSGNSVPEYIPDESFFAMVTAAWEHR
jgi:uroporphyrinogen decarboxylase